MSSEELTGRTLGDFVVRHRLGEGGYGAVYRAEQPLLGREAVIKVLHDRHRHSKTLIQRFLREARLASRLDHPYAAHIYAFGVEPDGLMWIAMEYVKGQTLHELLRTRGAMPLDELVPLLDRICEVLQAAHDLGIVHRDIKPPNVMVMQRSGRAFPKLLDFGIAKLTVDDLTPPRLEPSPSRSVPTPTSPDTQAPITIGEYGDGTMSFVGQPGGVLGGVLGARQATDTGALASTMQADLDPGDEPLTEAGAAVGSPPYMAPEQWGDAEATTTRTDLYALGVLAYEALTGRRPFTGTTVMAFAVAHATNPVPPLGEGFPAALDEVMEKALAKEAADRYASALEFAQAFRTAAGFGSPPLPSLDEELRLSVEASFPQPIAEAVAAYHAARNAHHGRDALRDIATTALRYLATIALAARAQVQLAEAGSTAAIAELLRDLRRRPLRDEEWLRLARELVAAFRTRPQAHPMPELVALLQADGEGDPLTAVAQDRTADPDPLPALRELLPRITRLLRALSFLADYPLVVVVRERAESWMGVRRPRRVALEIHGRTIEAGQPVVLDAASHPTVVLWPIAQTSPPMPGAPEELFLLDGGGRRGARMVALPNTLERQDDRVWQWLADGFSTPDRDTPVSPDSHDARPYRGLGAFTTQDAHAFVGREREIDAAVNRLTTSALVAVVGPSGAGKSSFVHAGILPALPTSWTAISVRPGASPIAALELRLRRAGFAVPDLASALDRDPNALGALVDARATPIVLVIDQFEELFTLGAPIDERRAYIRALLAAAQTTDDNLRVVLTLRDDFLGRATQVPELRDRLPAALFLLGTPARADLVRILTEPLAKQGFDFDDPALPARMVDEVAETPGALALLSFTASKLWELRDRHFRQLTRKAYDALGGVAGALAQHAETTLAGLSANEQRLARGAFGHLVTADGTRATLTRGELDQLLRDPAAGTVLEKLVAARLLVTTESEGGEDRVEIIHEALLAAWPRFADWRREDLEGARLRDQIRAAARQWVERERPRGLLWRDDALAELQVWRTRHPQPLTDAEEAFVGASLAEATRGRRVRRGVIGVVIGLMAVAVAVLVWARSNIQATAARALVERGRQNLLAAKSADAREAFAEARRLGASDTASLRFLETMAAQRIQGRTATLYGHTALVDHVQFSPDGTRVLSASIDGTARLWDPTSATEVALLAGCAGSVLEASFDPTGRRIAAQCADGVVRIYDATGHREHELAASVQRPDVLGLVTVRFSADGTRLATSFAGVVQLWDVVTGRRLWQANTTKPQGRIAIAPNGKIVASMSATQPAVTLWDAETGAPLRVLALHGTSWEPLFLEPTALAFDATGTRLFTIARRTELVQIWDVATGALAGTIEPRAGLLWLLRVSGDGRRIAIASRNVIQIWSVATSTLEHTLATGANQVLDLQFSPRDELLGATMNDGSVALWHVGSGIEVADLQGHAGAALALAFDPRTERVVTGGADMTAIVWTLRAAATAKVLVPESPANDSDLRGDRLLVASSYATVWNLDDGAVVARRWIGPNADARFVDDHTIVIVDADGKLWAWDLASSTTRELARHARPGDWVIPGADGTVASWAGPEVIVADARSGTARFRWTAGAAVTSLAFLPGTGRIVVADAAMTIHVVGASGKLETSWRTETRISFVAGLPDGRVVSVSPYVVQLWSPTGQLIHAFDHRSAMVSFMAIDRDGTKIATAGQDGMVRIWDLATYALIAKLPHTSFQVTLAFGRDDHLLATLDDEGIVRIWSVAGGEQLFQFSALHGRGLISLSDDVAVATGLETITVLPLR